MYFDGAHADAQIQCDVAIVASGHNMFHDLAFPWRQRLHAVADGGRGFGSGTDRCAAIEIASLATSGT
mgnify:CR=1 FL=1